MSNSRLDILKSLVEQDPANAFTRYGLAMELRSRGDLTGAAGSFEELMTGFPDYVPTYLMAAGVFAELGRQDDRVHALRRGIEISTARGDGHAKKELEAALAEAMA